MNRTKKRVRGRWRRRFRRKKIDFKKGLFLLPHLFTFANAFFGFGSVIAASNGFFTTAAHFILLGALMDMLDGRLARVLGTTSEFGVQIDSLSDAVTFCFAPAYLVYAMYLESRGLIGVAISFVFLMAGMIRLARFNIIHEKQTIFFLGLPTTIAGSFLTVVLLNIGPNAEHMHLGRLLGALVLFLSYLMVSSHHFPAFKKTLYKPRNTLLLTALLVVGTVVAVLRVHGALALFFLIYFLYSVTLMGRQRLKRRQES